MYDPLAARDYVAAFTRAFKAWKAGRITEQHWKDVSSAFEALDIVFPDTEPHAKLAKDLLGLGQAAVRGEFETREHDGALVMGDRAMELAEQLYKYAEEREEE